MTADSYIIRGGTLGRERLRLLARVMRPTTLALLERVGLRSGVSCLDLGCGGGDVTFDLAELVGPQGRVVGLDMDPTKLDLARQEAAERRLDRVEFRLAEINSLQSEPAFNLVYARFLLSHLTDPAAALATMAGALRPGGVVVVEDIDFTGHFCQPDCPPFWRYVDLFARTARARGVDPAIGPRLPGLLLDAGLQRVNLNVVQPAALEGETNLVAPLTMENIADSVVGAGLATRHEVEQIIADLYEFARRPRVILSLPRVVQAWGWGVLADS